MKTIYRDEYENDGIFIDLEHDYNYEELIMYHGHYLNPKEKYYVWCRGGVKSHSVVEELISCGYDAVRVISR